MLPKSNEKEPKRRFQTKNHDLGGTEEGMEEKKLVGIGCCVHLDFPVSFY